MLKKHTFWTFCMAIPEKYFYTISMETAMDLYAVHTDHMENTYSELDFHAYVSKITAAYFDKQ